MYLFLLLVGFIWYSYINLSHRRLVPSHQTQESFQFLQTPIPCCTEGTRFLFSTNAECSPNEKRDHTHRKQWTDLPRTRAKDWPAQKKKKKKKKKTMKQAKKQQQTIHKKAQNN